MKGLLVDGAIGGFPLHLPGDGDFGYIPRGTNEVLRHGILQFAKQGLSYVCMNGPVRL